MACSTFRVRQCELVSNEIKTNHLKTNTFCRFVGSLVVFFASLFAVIDRENLKEGQAGLSLSYALGVSFMKNAYFNLF